MRRSRTCEAGRREFLRAESIMSTMSTMSIMSIRCIVCAVCIMNMICMSGCAVRKIEMDDRHKKTYERVSPEKLPEMCKKQVEMCKKNPFSYVYEENGLMYLARGYGEKETGGYRVKIIEVAETSNAVFLKTELCGSAQKMPKKKTYPYCVVKVHADGKIAVFE